MNELVTRFTSLPNLHPALVHFPIALLPVAVLLDLAAFWIPRQREWLDRAATVLYVASALGALAAYRAGRLAADGLPPLALSVQLHVNEHSDSARAAVWLVGLLAAARLAVALRDTRFRRKALRLVLLAIALGGIVLVYQTADLGGGLVYQHRVGVAESDDRDTGVATEQLVESAATDAAKAGAEDRLIKTPEGGWTWNPDPADREVLGAVLKPAPQTDMAAVAWVEPVEGDRGLGLAVDGQVLLLLPGTFGDVEVQAEFDASEFEGELGLAHHVLSGSQAGLLTVTLPSNEIALIDQDGGKRRSLARATRPVDTELFQLRVTAAGRHFYGFLGEQRVVHGHESPAGEGGCGLFLRGKGIVRILSMTVTPN